MVTREQQRQGTELMKTLVEKAWESTAFKDQLVQNTVATIESITGNKVNKEFKFVVEDQTDASKIYLNIPRNVQIENIELTDEQLEIVAGGEIIVAASVVGGIVIGVSIWAATHQ